MDSAHKYGVPETSFDEFERAGYAKDTVWFNPTELPVKILLHESTPWATGRPPVNEKERTGKRPFVIGPKEKKALPSEFDRAIHQIDPETGMIIGGLAPQLRREGELDRPLHPALDNERSLRMQAEANAAKLLLDLQAQQQALLIAQAEAEKMKALLADREAALAKNQASLKKG